MYWLGARLAELYHQFAPSCVELEVVQEILWIAEATVYTISNLLGRKKRDLRIWLPFRWYAPQRCAGVFLGFLYDAQNIWAEIGEILRRTILLLHSLLQQG